MPNWRRRFAYAQRLVQGSLGDAHSQRRHADARAGKHRQHVLEPFIHLAEKIFPRDAHVVEMQRGRIRRANPELLLQLADAQARRLSRDDER